jgi:hypothetical protein
VPDYLPALRPAAEESTQPLRFDPRLAAPFCEKSLSEETRRAYRRVVKEFFLFVKGAHPSQVTPAQVLSWRDRLKGERKKAVTISFKLTDESRAIRGRVQAVVRRGPFLSSSDPLLLLRAPTTFHPTLKFSFDFTRPTTSRARPRPAAPFAIAFVPGQHRHTYIDPGPATRITSAIAFALGTRL